jgi:hypothetical protein
MRSYQQKMQAVAAAAAEYIAGIAVTTQFLRYARAAHRDERNGFRYSAAIQWRRAADLFGSNRFAVEYCWQQWERIMRVPRRLAVPISDPTELIEVAA